MIISVVYPALDIFHRKMDNYKIKKDTLMVFNIDEVNLLSYLFILCSELFTGLCAGCPINFLDISPQETRVTRQAAAYPNHKTQKPL